MGTLLALTYTVRYDGLCMGPSQVMPDELLASIEARSSPSMHGHGHALPPGSRPSGGGGLAQGEYQQLEGGFHEVPATTLAPVIADFIRRTAN